MKDNTYNGYTNRASWLAALWFNNDEFLYTIAKTARNKTNLTAIFWSEINLFKDFYDEDNNLDNELINTINWNEVFNNTGNREP